jgi:hypothetical protein
MKNAISLITTYKQQIIAIAIFVACAALFVVEVVWLWGFIALLYNMFWV